MTEEEFEELRLESDVLKQLKKHPGWLLLMSHVKEQVRMRTRMILSEKRRGLDGLIDMGNEQNELLGVKLIPVMVDMLIEEKEGFMQDYLNMKDEENENA